MPPRPLPYRKPTRGRDYWILDDALPDPDAVRARCLAKEDWVQGAPHRPEPWPGLRAMPALEPDELAGVERLVRQATGARRIWAEPPAAGGTFNHNCVQVVGKDECESRPHTDSRTVCRFAAVLYLGPDVPKHCGTSFYRQQLPGGGLGGNQVLAPYNNLVDALGTRFVPPDSFTEDVRVPHRYNRLLLYSANLIHSATDYWGSTLEDKRMTAVFFWMA
ncbi:DUF6445 family protein [Streptomyces lavendulae]|uniref:DUF6445 family protein n=1 Tax=Streptomyces lavendulae TaxID=1914 RepID=UPI0024A466E2|nr:DUF6445 family protein [Streptomyces lavendulae]GLX17406.1 hypothetical protein Slala01_10500 [Streptomyces lavendulae subsp. lavendulae]GLX24734.1 hypothetical protein Slala02_05540 [Streptomyces lavendulae subsp. lavendulae]